MVFEQELRKQFGCSNLLYQRGYFDLILELLHRGGEELLVSLDLLKATTELKLHSVHNRAIQRSPLLQLNVQ